ncbi:MAG: DUF349 domain-containing protein, partial [Prevotella sp.]|nr:DUF349 domain-containing protein [Prevotella sp.]
MTEIIVPELPASEDDNKQPELSAEPQASVLSQVATKEDIVRNMKDLLEKEDLPTRTEVDSLKQAFYKLRAAETEAQKEKFAAEGGDPAAFVPASDNLDEELKELLNALKEKRAKQAAAEEKIKEDNLVKKLQIIDKLKNFTEKPDDFGRFYKEFQSLQQEWNEIKLVPQGKEKELWRSYQTYTEKFYDLLKINIELRDYDFRKNLELKTAICETVEKLSEEADVVSAFHQLQNFHQQWRDIGPVAKTLREEIWERFKKASTTINKKYQEHFIQLKTSEESNLVEKTAICEALKAIDYSSLSTPKEWDGKTKEVIALQEKWKTIGFVPRKVNTQIFEEFRSLCDAFFDRKAAYFKSQKSELETNLEKKRALCEKAKSLKDSSDWKTTADQLIAIQKEWKTIGPIPRKYSDALWKEFVGACDYFFEQRNKIVDSKKGEEQANLSKKKEIIVKIKELGESMDANAVMPELRACMDEWNAVGFVPFKEKDKIYKEYQAALDAHFDRLKLSKNERRIQSFKSTVEDLAKADRPKGKLLKERERLMHQYAKVKTDLQTYENNMGFLSLSKTAGALMK